VEAVAVDHLATAQREDLHDGAIPLVREADHVDGADGLPLDRLPLGESLYGEETVPVARRVLEALLVRGLLHLLLELALDRPRVPGEELDYAVDDRAVVFLQHVPHARRQT